MSNGLTLSASALTDFFTCPARFRFSREYRPDGIEEPPYFKLGHEVHGLMEGRLHPGQVSPAAVRMGTKLLQQEQAMGLVTVARELRQTITLLGVPLKRVIDLAARTKDGAPVLADYKTAGKPWETIQTEWGPMAPKALGFQPVIYLLKPETDNPYQEGAWPVVIRFLVVSSMGHVAQHDYYYQETDYRNLLDAVEMVLEAVERKRFPVVRGYACGDCMFRFRCFNTPGWEELYTPTGLKLTEE